MDDKQPDLFRLPKELINKAVAGSFSAKTPLPVQAATAALNMRREQTSQWLGIVKYGLCGLSIYDDAKA